LAPCFADANSFHIPKADGVQTDELLDQFQQKGASPVYVTSNTVAAKFRSIVEELERSSDGTLQFLAKIQKLALSNLFANPPLDNQRALEEMFDYLMGYGGTIDHKMQVGQGYISSLFAKGVCRKLNNVIASRTYTANAQPLVEALQGHNIVET